VEGRGVDIIIVTAILMHPPTGLGLH